MPMTLRLTEHEHDALRSRAEADGISLQEAARQAIREYVALRDHRDRVTVSGARILTTHTDALRRLGE